MYSLISNISNVFERRNISQFHFKKERVKKYQPRWIPEEFIFHDSCPHNWKQNQPEAVPQHEPLHSHLETQSHLQQSQSQPLNSNTSLWYDQFWNNCTNDDFVLVECEETNRLPIQHSTFKSFTSNKKNVKKDSQKNSTQAGVYKDFCSMHDCM